MFRCYLLSALSGAFLTHTEEEDTSHTGAALPDGGRVVLQPDAGH